MTSEPNLDQDVNFTGERLQKQEETSPVRQEALTHMTGGGGLQRLLVVVIWPDCF